MTTASTDCGILFIATGARYVDAAIRAARRFRAVMPAVPIALQTDAPDKLPGGLFARVGRIEDGHARSKVDCLARTPFERTLYLDTDIQPLEDVSELFQLLDRFDIGLAHAHARNRKATREAWTVELPDAFPQLNGGVILYRRTEPVMRFFADWSAAYQTAGFKKDQVTLRELVWRSDLRLAVLPPEYNVRYLRYAYFWDDREARPRLLHLRRFHDAGQSRGRIAADRWKEVRADFGAALRALGGAAKQALFLGGRERP